MKAARSTWTRTGAVGVAAAAVAVLATNAVVGAQSAQDVIHACADNSRGVLRMVRSWPDQGRP